MEEDRLHILMIEDSPGDIGLVTASWSEGDGDAIDMEQADRLATGLARLACDELDAVLLDLVGERREEPAAAIVAALYGAVCDSCQRPLVRDDVSAVIIKCQGEPS